MSVISPGDFRFHHVGLACKQISVEMKAHMALGFAQETDFFYDPIQKINGIFVVNSGVRIELLEPAVPDSPLKDILQRGQKMYHQCFECPDLDRSIEYLEGVGARPVTKPAPAVAFNGRRIVFIMLRTMMLVELIES
ncbi:VOC family protein [Paenibacillus cymbidii]|uniref:VOC family protein n=1 Tax=Paenibacillus cymbidii TaxID=1639034 RepID=UPI0010814DE0|nr:VOC family protein [Paenibacillus cymbidii]